MSEKNHDIYEFEFKTCFEEENIFKLLIKHTIEEFNQENMYFLILTNFLADNNIVHIKSLATLCSKDEYLLKFRKNVIIKEIIHDVNEYKLDIDEKELNTENKLETIRISSKKNNKSNEEIFNDNDIKWLESSFKQDILNCIKNYILYSNIMQLFVIDNAEHAINISSSSKHKLLEYWRKYEQTYKEIVATGKYPNNYIETTKEIFKPVRQEISQSLYFDIFPRFKRSNAFLNYIDSLSLNKVQLIGSPRGTYHLENYLLTLEDLDRCYITHKDIRLCKLLMEDFYHWKSIHSSPKDKLNIYTSGVPILCSQASKIYGSLYACKTTYQFNCNALEFILMFTNPKNYVSLSELSKIDVIDYISNMQSSYDKTSKKTIDKFSQEKKIDVSDISYTDLQFLVSNYNMKDFSSFPCSVLLTEKNSFLIKRDFLQTCTTFYDPTVKTFYHIFKYCHHYNSPCSNLIRGITYGLTSVTHLTDSTCLYQTVFFVNLRGYLSNLSSSPLARYPLISHISSSIKHMNQLLHSPPSIHSDDYLLLFPLLQQLLSS